MEEAVVDDLRIFETVGGVGLGDGVQPVLLFKDEEPFPAPGSCEQAVRDVCAIELKYGAKDQQAFMDTVTRHAYDRHRHLRAVETGLTYDEVLSIAWYTSDVRRSLGLPVESNGWWAMNDRLRRRDVDGLCRFRPVVYFLHRALEQLSAADRSGGASAAPHGEQILWRGLPVRLTVLSR